MFRRLDAFRRPPRPLHLSFKSQVFGGRPLGLQLDKQQLRYLSSSRFLLNKRLTEVNLKVSKSQLLAQASSPLSRLWVHIKWPLTRNDRPFTIDELSAFASWLVMGNVLWIILGTTTFGLVTMYSIHTFDTFWNKISGDDDDDGGDDRLEPSKKDKSFLGYLAGLILFQGLGFQVMFDKGNVLPELSDGMLKFKNLKIASIDDVDGVKLFAKIKELNLTLSFKKWYRGLGLIEDMEIFGMNAKIYERPSQSVISELEQDSKFTHETINSFAYSMSKYDSNNIHNDFHEHKIAELKSMPPAAYHLIDPSYSLNHVKIHDSFAEIHGHETGKPLGVTIFNCDLPRLRGDRLLIDFFNASNVTGAINNSMFTIHKHQIFGGDDNIVRFKLDSVDMESLSRTDPQLKFNWLASGKAEIFADIRLPQIEDSRSTEGLAFASTSFFKRVWNDLVFVTSTHSEEPSGTESKTGLIKGAITALYETFKRQTDGYDEDARKENDSEYVIVNVKVKFKNLKAILPLHLPMATSSEVPFITLQDLRSLIGYINGIDTEKAGPLVIKTTVIEKLSDLYNLENLYQTRIFDGIISDIYEDFMKMVEADERRIMELKSSMWSHSVASQLLLLGLGALA